MKKIGLIILLVMVVFSGGVYAGEKEDVKQLEILDSLFDVYMKDLVGAKAKLDKEDAKLVFGEEMYLLDLEQKVGVIDSCVSAKWSEKWLVDVRVAFEEVFSSIRQLKGVYEDAAGRAKMLDDMQKTLEDAMKVLEG